MTKVISISERQATLAQPDFAEKSRMMAAMACARDLTAGARSVGSMLLYHWNMKTGQCNPGVALLAKETGFDVRTVRRALEELTAVDGYFVELDTSAGARARGFRHYQPRLDRIKVLAQETVGAPIGRTDQAAGQRDPLDGRGDPAAGRRGPANIEEPKNEPSKEPIHDEGLIDGFERLVTTYRPSPGDPFERARPLFERIVAEGTDADQLITAANQYLQHITATNWQAKRYLVNWLRDSCWKQHAPAVRSAPPSALPLVRIRDDADPNTADWWRAKCEALMRRFGREVEPWLCHVEVQGDRLVADGLFFRDWITNHFGKAIGRPIELRSPRGGG